MAKKKFNSLNAVFNTEPSKKVNTFEVKKYKSYYDYTGIKSEDKDTLILSEEDIMINKEKVNEGYFNIAKNLYTANQILASYDNTSGKFINWFQGLGLKKTFVYNSIKRYNLYLLTNEEKKVNRLSQKAVEMIGSKKVDDSLKIEILKEDGIENKSDRDLREYILEIISEHSEMKKNDEKSSGEKIIKKEKIELELNYIEEKLKNFKDELLDQCSEEQYKKMKKIKKILEGIMD